MKDNTVYSEMQVSIGKIVTKQAKKGEISLIFTKIHFKNDYFYFKIKHAYDHITHLFFKNDDDTMDKIFLRSCNYGKITFQFTSFIQKRMACYGKIVGKVSAHRRKTCGNGT